MTVPPRWSTSTRFGKAISRDFVNMLRGYFSYRQLHSDVVLVIYYAQIGTERATFEILDVNNVQKSCVRVCRVVNTLVRTVENLVMQLFSYH